MGAADAKGLVVSYIQSLYWEFGSGCVLPATGVLMQNRGISLSLQPGALNMLAPGRSVDTLNPALAVLRDGRVMAYGTMGGDGQPQTQVRCSPATSRSARRWHQHSTGRAGCWDGRGARNKPSYAWNRASTAIWSIRLPLPATRSTFCPSRIPTLWDMLARRCCIPTAPAKARTIRAPTAARREFEQIPKISGCGECLISAAFLPPHSALMCVGARAGTGRCYIVSLSFLPGWFVCSPWQDTPTRIRMSG